MRTVVLGLGNPLRRDDGVGLAVVAELARRLREAPLPGVDVLASTRAGFELIDLLRGYGRAIIVDCLEPSDPRPGRVRRLRLEDVSGSARLVNAHELSLAAAFRLARQMAVPMPGEVEILAVEAEDTLTIAEELSPAVRPAVGPLAQELYQTLQRDAPATEPPDSQEFRTRRALYAPDLH